MRRPLRHAVLLAALGACQPRARPLDVLGPMRTIELSADAPRPARVAVTMARGTLILTPGGTRTIAATVQTNLPAFEPVLERTTNGLELSQRTRDVERRWPEKAQARWELALGSQPLDLLVQLDTGDGELELGGLALRSLELRGDAGSIRVAWKVRNAAAGGSIDVATYVGPIHLKGLGHARAAKVRVRNLVGPITVDLGPALDRDLELRIEGVTSPVTVVVPAETVAARALVEQPVAVVHAPGWIEDGDGFRLGDPAARPRASIFVRAPQAPVQLATR